ncbi:MAG TPA: M12 family metallo-peptidase [Ferruginibacter sp.]|nr:M12 family metallo-peptidase [Ferruginibacter sp.]
MKQPIPMAVMPRAVSLILFSFLFSVAFPQTNSRTGMIAERIAILKQQGIFSKETALFKTIAPAAPDPAIIAAVKKYSFIEAEGIEAIRQEKPGYITFNIPAGNGNRNLKVLLFKENISTSGFTIKTEKGNVSPEDDIVHYRGTIDNEPNSLAALSFANDEVSGFVSTQEGNYVIGRSGTAKGRHIIYNDADLTQQVPFDCGTNTAIPSSPATLARTTEVAAVTNKCVKWYWETDYDLFVNKGSLAAVNAYMQAVFNQMATLYANDGMTMQLKTLFVWTTEDPYTGNSTSGYLTQFGNYRTTFDGDLAHLIGMKGGGGIAWINGACKTNKYRMAYSGISASYQNVPTYSWTVECISHEQGHLLGSQHTHDCVWNGNNTKIDGCGDAAGYSSGSCAVPSPLPTRGTIMSYCHLLSGVGINFGLGFGPLPAERMINTINAASCLVACTTCTVPIQPGTITGTNSVCSGSSQTYTVTTVAGATSYTWVLPTGWSGTSTTNTITVTAGTSNGNIAVTANNSCGNSTARTLAVTSSSTPATPVSITGNTAVCPATTQTYTAVAVAGATSYLWTLPSGWTGTSSTNSITVTAGSTGGQLTVKTNNGCGQSAALSLTLTITSAAPPQPGAVAGNSNVCAGSSQTYSIAAVAGAALYNWTLPQGWTGTSSTNSITVTAGASAGNITVVATNGCGSSTARTVAVATSPLPAAPGGITVSGGSSTVCTGNTRTYTTPLVSGLTYSWTVPAGTTIVTGQNSNSIQLSFGSSFVSGSVLSVRAANNCGNSSPASIIINKSTLATPGTISGPNSSCPNITRGFSVSAVSGATSYIWTIPAGASFVGSATGRIIWVNVGAISGNVTVKAVSACGSSAASSKYLTIGCSSGIEESSMPKVAAVYPNPATEKATVRFNAIVAGAYTFSIADVTGRIVTKKTMNAAEGLNFYSFDVTNYLPGTYFVMIQCTSNNEILKLHIK